MGVVVRYGTIHTPLAGAAYTTSFLAYAEGAYRLEQWRERRHGPPTPVAEPMSYAEAWFEQLCIDAEIAKPIVKSHWPTELGHAYCLAITGWVTHDGRPVTVDSWLGNCALLHDTAGPSCTFVRRIDEVRVGGIATIEFEGIRLEDYVAPPVPDPIPECSIDGCTTTASRHALLDINGESQALLCGVHLASHHGSIIDSHPALPTCSHERWWYELDDGTASGCTDVAPELPAPEEADRKCTPDSEPLLPLHILGADQREGSGEGQGWPAPTGPAHRAPVVRPPGATEGSRGGRIFDLLACAQGPLRRGTLAAASDPLRPLSPTTVDKLLTAWADLGVCHKTGQLWQIAPDYSTSASLTDRGREEEPGG